MTHLPLRCEVISCQSIFARLRCDSLPDEIRPGSFLAINDRTLYISDLEQNNQVLEVCVHGMNAEAELGENEFNAELYVSTSALCAENQPVLVTANVEQLGAFVLAARRMRRLCNAEKSMFVLVGEGAFPFKLVPSKFVVRSVPSHVMAGIPLLEDWGLPSRLVSSACVPGTYEGSIEEFIEEYMRKVDCDMAGEYYVLRLDQ